MLINNERKRTQSFADGPNYVEWGGGGFMMQSMFHVWWMFKTNFPFVLYSLLTINMPQAFNVEGLQT